jgi:hypothetical protein
MLFGIYQQHPNQLNGNHDLMMSSRAEAVGATGER